MDSRWLATLFIEIELALSGQKTAFFKRALPGDCMGHPEPTGMVEHTRESPLDDRLGTRVPSGFIQPAEAVAYNRSCFFA
jgi:hypothetical protein